MSTVTAAANFDFLSFDHNQAAQPIVRSMRLAPGLDFAFVYPGSRPVALDAVCLFGTPDSNGQAVEGLVIEEVSTSGSVPYLLAKNESNLDFLLLAGQIVKGGKQNRGINLDVLVAAGETTKIPVTCVEQGRWSGGPRARFQHGGIEPLSVRTMKMRDAHACRRADRSVVADQNAVWDEIVRMEHAVGSRSASHDLIATLSHASSRRSQGAEPRPSAADPTASATGGGVDPSHELRALEESLRALEHELHSITEMLANGPIPRPDESHSDREALLRRLGSCERQAARLRTRRIAILRDGPGGPGVVGSEAIQAADSAAQGACGMLVFMRNEFIAGDLFADPSWFQHVYRDLRDSALLSWDAARLATSGTARGGTRTEGHGPEDQARGIVRDAIHGDWRERPAVGHGMNMLLSHASLDGAMVVGREQTPLHVLLGTLETPAVFAGGRGWRRRDLRNFPME